MRDEHEAEKKLKESVLISRRINTSLNREVASVARNLQEQVRVDFLSDSLPYSPRHRDFRPIP